MKAKFTKGEWGINEFKQEQIIVDNGELEKWQRPIICQIFGDPSTEEVKANIRLIAAAPKLLSELILLLEAYKSDQPEIPSWFTKSSA